MPEEVVDKPERSQRGPPTMAGLVYNNIEQYFEETVSSGERLYHLPAYARE